MRYKKNFPKPVRQPSPVFSESVLLGMLYVVDVRLVRKDTNEKITHKLLLVGCEHADIERKLRWVFNANEYSQISISKIDKVREKVHFLKTTVSMDATHDGPVIERDEGTQNIYQGQSQIEQYDPRLYAIGLATTMLAKDERHALRKISNALAAMAAEGSSHSGNSLSENSTLEIEEIPRTSGYARPKDVSNERNMAHFVRG